ncbi:hypothetical protein B0J13DRAFT_644367 [Dactylonectria estremocensis]|uniref:Uncharacterized protein n=1 Tax=Dactylonectria estremocensis TaxID=1079267 RepID=A0A9P9FEW1_9HYPO|nr:hypothetical protein B0J13DRAFT_644367 [Dactylonectria estremocensis]
MPPTQVLPGGLRNICTQGVLYPGIVPHLEEEDHALVVVLGPALPNSNAILDLGELVNDVVEIGRAESDTWKYPSCRRDTSAREDIKISFAVFLVTSFTPKCDGHAKERLRDDEVSFLARILNVPAVLVPDLDLHAEGRSGELGSVKRNYEVASDDCVPAGNDQQVPILGALAILGGYVHCLQRTPAVREVGPGMPATDGAACHHAGRFWTQGLEQRPACSTSSGRSVQVVGQTKPMTGSSTDSGILIPFKP